MIGWLLGLLAASAAPAPPAQAPSRPAPGRWIVDWGEQRCSLVRDTGGIDPVSLMIRTIPGAGQAELWLLDPNWRGAAFHRRRPFEISLLPSDFRVTAQALSVRYRNQQGIAVTNVDEGFLKNLPGSESVRIEGGDRTVASVELPGSARAVAALRECEATVLRDWGLDPKVIFSLRQGPQPIQPVVSRFSDTDYPGEAISAGESGSVLARMMIDSAGRVRECVVVDSSGSAALDQRTCKVLVARVRFRPALDSSGAPTRGISAVRIHWLLPV
jgi:TonB family protein